MTQAPAAYENKNPFEQRVTQKNNNKNTYRSHLRALKNSLFFSSSSCCCYRACSVDAKLAADENNAKSRRRSIFIMFQRLSMILLRDIKFNRTIE